jgi:tetratricopeptide (TPR) repeat protein
MPKPGHRESQPSNEIARFTDRDDQRAIFRRLLDSATEPPVLMFYGVGGSGKSWLLKQLRQETPADIPSALLDFDVAAGGHGFVLDPAAALHEIRRQLRKPAPRFDLAFAMLRHKQGVPTDSDHWLIELLAELAGVVPGGSFALKKLSRPLLARLKGTPPQLAHDLHAMTTQEIGEKLVDYLAEDLREALETHLQQAVRVVLFFDTFEAVGAGLQNEEQRRFREQWVRDVASNFDFALTVIAGQNRLNWDEADCRWSEYLEQHIIGGLSEPDARRFLTDCEIGGALQNAILTTTLEEGGGHHCYSLGLCADIVAAERRKGQVSLAETLEFRPQDWESLARRFLKSLDSDSERRWIERLALTPRFDEAAARNAFSPQPSVLQDAEWGALLDYSFVLPLPSATPWFAIRAQMRWALENQPSARSRVKADHKWWQVYWTTRKTSPVDDAASLAWYHSYYAVEHDFALDEWSNLAKAARTSVPPRMQEHFNLLQWWEPIGLLEGPLTSCEAARACNNLGIEVWQSSLGNRTANLHQAMACFEAVLRVCPEEGFPQNWAMAQHNLGLAWSNMPEGDVAANLGNAMACYQAALRVYTERDFPQDWAATENSLGVAWQRLPTGDRAENLRQAMACYLAALRVWTEEDFPQSWAMTKNNLGTAWHDLPAGDFADNLGRALDCYKAALRVRTEEHFPQDWAMTQNNLGSAWAQLPTGDRAANLRLAIDGYKAALRVRTEQVFPQDWAITQNNLGNAWAFLASGDRAANLRNAIACFEAAIRVRTERDFPQDWALTLNNLGNAWTQMPAGDRAANLRHAIECYEAALRVRTEEAFPQDWALTQTNLGSAWAQLPDGDLASNVRRAITCHQAALRIYTEQEFPQGWARVQNNLGKAWAFLPHGDSAANVRQAIECYKAAMRVRTQKAFPNDWAETQTHLGNAWLQLPAGDRAVNLRHAIDCFSSALSVFNEENFPQGHRTASQNLALALIALQQLSNDEPRSSK